MNNPLNRTMFRQAGMSKQPMGILASSPELMTTAQKAMANGQPIRAQNAVSVNTANANINTPQKIINSIGLNSSSPFNMSNIMNKFSYGSGDGEKTYETKLIKEGSPSAGFKEITPVKKEEDENTVLNKIQSVTDQLNKVKKERKELGNIKIKDSDSDFIKDAKKVGNFFYGPDGAVTKFGESIYQKFDDTVVNYFLDKPDIISKLQKEMNEKASVDPNYQYTDQAAGATRMLAPSEEELVKPRDENEVSVDLPTPRPQELPGVVALKKISDVSKNKNGITTTDSDTILGINDIKSYSDKVQARRDILSKALNRDIAEKDVRTDVNYNLMMTGLLVMAGESPEAMTNLAKGLATGLGMYGKAQGEDSAARRKEEVAIGLAAAEQQFKSDEAEKNRSKTPDAVKTLEYYKKNPRMFALAQSLKTKNLTMAEIRLALAKQMVGDPLMPFSEQALDEATDAVMSINYGTTKNTGIGQLPSSTIPLQPDVIQAIEDGKYRIGHPFLYKGIKFEVDKGGKTASAVG